VQEVKGSNLCAVWCSDSAINYSMPRPNKAQAGTCRCLAAALHSLTYTCLSAGCSCHFAACLKAAKSCLLAAFCGLPSTACWLPSAGWTQHPSMYRSPRGPAPIRTTASGPGSGSYPAPSSSGQGEGSSNSSGNLASALAQRLPGGYTALAPGQGRGEGRDMVAGEHIKIHSDAQSVKTCASISSCCNPLLFCTARCIATRHLHWCDTCGTRRMRASLCGWQALLMAGRAGLMSRGDC